MIETSWCALCHWSSWETPPDHGGDQLLRLALRVAMPVEEDSGDAEAVSYQAGGRAVCGEALKEGT